MRNKRKKRICKNVLLVGELSKKHGRMIDYYLYVPGGGKLYAFTKNYTKSCYEKCKSGIPVEKLLTTRDENPAIMALVKYVRYLESYLIDYYDLPVYDTKEKTIRNKKKRIRVPKHETGWDRYKDTEAA